VKSKTRWPPRFRSRSKVASTFFFWNGYNCKRQTQTIVKKNKTHGLHCKHKHLTPH
jgi:hypothetical protein